MQVYVIGDVGILEELDLLGFKHIGGPEDGGKDIDLGPGYALPHDHDVCLSSYTLHPTSKFPNLETSELDNCCPGLHAQIMARHAAASVAALDPKPTLAGSACRSLQPCSFWPCG